MSEPDHGRCRTPRALLTRLVEMAILKAHGLAARFELIPEDFGSRRSIDETHAQAVLAEWVRCARLWADYNPEEVFAWKVGAGLMFLVIAGLLVLVANMD